MAKAHRGKADWGAARTPARAPDKLARAGDQHVHSSCCSDCPFSPADVHPREPHYQSEVRGYAIGWANGRDPAAEAPAGKGENPVAANPDTASAAAAATRRQIASSTSFARTQAQAGRDADFGSSQSGTSSYGSKAGCSRYATRPSP